METDSAPEAALEPRRSAYAVRLLPKPSARVRRSGLTDEEPH